MAETQIISYFVVKYNIVVGMHNFRLYRYYIIYHIKYFIIIYSFYFFFLVMI